MNRFTEQQLDDLESLTNMPAWKTIIAERDLQRQQTLVKNSQAKNRDLVQKDVIIHETAIETIQRNLGFLQGIEHLINLVENARAEKIKQKQEGHATRKS